MRPRRLILVALLAALANAPIAMGEVVLCSAGAISESLPGGDTVVDGRTIQCLRDSATAVIYRFPELPANVNLDAIASAPSGTGWVFSVDRGFHDGNQYFDPADLVLADDQGLSLYLDPSTALALGGPLNVDALAFDAGEPLISLSETHATACGTATDADVIRLGASAGPCVIEFTGRAAGLSAGVVGLDVGPAEWRVALDRSASVDGITVSRQGVLGLTGAQWRLVTDNIGHADNRPIAGLAMQEVEILFDDGFESNAARRTIRLR